MGFFVICLIILASLWGMSALNDSRKDMTEEQREAYDNVKLGGNIENIALIVFVIPFIIWLLATAKW